MLFDTHDIVTNKIQSKELAQQGIELYILRLDLIHKIISGNKLFKLNYFLELALASTEKTIITFGGAYSNHLVATAFACKQLGLKSIGLVRGEKPSTLSHTLQYCMELNMQLKFLSREAYHEQASMGVANNIGTIVPEGGYHPLGAKGAAEIMNLFPQLNPTYIITATGTATTLAGLLMNKKATQQIISVPVIKGMHDIDERLHHLIGNSNISTYETWTDAHEGGYAKHNPSLIKFMNDFYDLHQIPTDIVYTGKMMKAVMQKIDEQFFEAGSKILCIHTGGLQGNLSFPPHTFVF